MIILWNKILLPLLMILAILVTLVFIFVFYTLLIYGISTMWQQRKIRKAQGRAIDNLIEEMLKNDKK